MKFLLIAALLFAPTAWAETYTIINTTTTQIGNLERTVWTIQAGSDPINRFNTYRVRKKHGARNEPVILTPTIASGFPEYEASPDNNYRHSFAGMLAKNKYTVWGISQRVGQLTPGTCEATPTACAAMQNWGLETLLDDVDFLRTQVAGVHGSTKPAIGGLSMGAMVAYASANRHPEAYAGIIGIDGGIFQTSQAGRDYAANWCTLLDGIIGSGLYYDSSAGLFNLLASNALNHPTDPNTVPLPPGFPTGLNNRQTFLFTLTEAIPNPASFRPGYLILVGDYLAETVEFSDFNFFARTVANTFTSYASIPLLRDLQCSLAAVNNTWYNNLSAYEGEVFVHVAGHGFGPTNLDTANLATNAGITLEDFPDFGHNDQLFSKKRKKDLDKPLLHWLKHEVF